MSSRTNKIHEVVLNNFSSYSTEELAKIIQFVAPPNIEGVTINVTEDNDGWDGTAYPDHHRVDIVLQREKNQRGDYKKKHHFPHRWAVNSELKDNYLRNIFFIGLEEFLVFLLAHEIFHLTKPNIRIFGVEIDKQLNIDEETICDLYGFICMSNWIEKRREQQRIDQLERNRLNAA